MNVSTVSGLSWTDYWQAKCETDIAHDFAAYERAEEWARQRFNSEAENTVSIDGELKKRIISDRPEGMSGDYVYGWNDCVNAAAARQPRETSLIPVDASALERLMAALDGPLYYIAELRATRNVDLDHTNPINILADTLREWKEENGQN